MGTRVDHNPHRDRALAQTRQFELVLQQTWGHNADRDRFVAFCCRTGLQREPAQRNDTGQLRCDAVADLCSPQQKSTGRSGSKLCKRDGRALHLVTGRRQQLFLIVCETVVLSINGVLPDFHHDCDNHDEDDGASVDNDCTSRNSATDDFNIHTSCVGHPYCRNQQRQRCVIVDSVADFFRGKHNRSANDDNCSCNNIGICVIVNDNCSSNIISISNFVDNVEW
jgi:hypothetical protein